MGRGKGYGTGSPVTFLCAVGRKEDWRTSQRYCDHNVKVTGRQRPYHSARGSGLGARSDSIAREYTCSCGHTGWSAHIDLKRYPIMQGNWDAETWGEKSEYGIDERTKLDGWNIGEEIEMISDQSDEGPFAGEIGTIVGIRHKKPSMFDSGERDELVVNMDDCTDLCFVDPLKVTDPDDDSFDEE